MGTKTFKKYLDKEIKKQEGRIKILQAQIHVTVMLKKPDIYITNLIGLIAGFRIVLEDLKKQRKKLKGKKRVKKK